MTFDDLARQQGAGGPVNPDDLYNVDATEDEKEAFMAALDDLEMDTEEEVPS